MTRDSDGEVASYTLITFELVSIHASEYLLPALTSLNIPYTIEGPTYPMVRNAFGDKGKSDI